MGHHSVEGFQVLDGPQEALGSQGHLVIQVAGEVLQQALPSPGLPQQGPAPHDHAHGSCHRPRKAHGGEAALTKPQAKGHQDQPEAQGRQHPPVEARGPEGWGR